MTVVAFVSDTDDALPVVSWAGRFAAAGNSELVVFFLPDATTRGSIAGPIEGDERPLDATHAAVLDAIENVVRTRRARSGRIPRHAVSVRRVPEVNPVPGTISRIQVESPELFVGSRMGSATTGAGKSLAQQIAAKITCDVVILAGEAERFQKSQQILVATTESPHDRAAVELAARAASSGRGTATIVAREAAVGEGAIEVGERNLRSLLRESGLDESSRIKLKVVLGDDWSDVCDRTKQECDLILVGANREKDISVLLDAAPGALVGLFRRAPRFGLGRRKNFITRLLPNVNATDYADLYEKLQAGSRWNSDFILMLSLAAAIASLGLLQSSPAVVIGSMLLAPLMTPMIGMGLALNQGNAKLAATCFRTIGLGFVTALGISMVTGVVTPGSELTLEIIARTEPNILDLLIALLSGVAAAYSLARPNVAASIAGVAIATALVPPLCSAGIALAYAEFPEAIGAFFLLVANVLTIILAAAGTFSMMGLSGLSRSAPRRFWVRHVVTGLMVCVLVMTIPLVSKFMQHVREGRDAPFALAVTGELREVVLNHFDTKPDVEVLFLGRAGIDRETEPIDVGIILSSKHPLPRSEEAELIQLIHETMQNPDLRVKVACVAAGWADEPDSQKHEDRPTGPGETDSDPSGVP